MCIRDRIWVIMVSRVMRKLSWLLGNTQGTHANPMQAHPLQLLDENAVLRADPGDGASCNRGVYIWRHVHRASDALLQV